MYLEGMLDLFKVIDRAWCLIIMLCLGAQKCFCAYIHIKIGIKVEVKGGWGCLGSKTITLGGELVCILMK